MCPGYRKKWRWMILLVFVVIGFVLFNTALAQDKKIPFYPRGTYLEEIPTIVLDNPTVRSSFIPTVQFTTAIYGIHETGTAYRMDEVPIPLQAVLPSRFPTDQRVLTQISAKFATLPE